MAEDGVEFLLSLNVEQEDALSFLKNIDKMTMSLRSVERTSRDAGHGHKKHAEEARGLDGVLKHLMSATLGPLSHKLKEVAEFEFFRRGVDAVIEAPMELIDKIKEIGEEMLNSAAKAERTEKSFGLLFGHEGAEEMLGWINKIKNSTEFTAETLEGATVSLAKVGFKGEGLIRAVSAATDLAALSPNKDEGFSEALSGLQQARRTGRVNNRTLRPLGVGEDDFLKQLSKRTGTDIKTLKKQLDAGKVDVDESLETLYTMIGKKTGKNLGGAGVEMSKTLEARLTHLKELPELYFKKLASSEGLDSFKEALGSALDQLDPDSPKGQQIFKSLEGAFNAVGSALKDIDMGALAGNVEAAMVTIADAIKPTIDVLKTLGDMIQGLDDFLRVMNDHPGEAAFRKAEANAEFKASHGDDYLVEARLKEMLRKKRADLAAGVVEYGPAEDPTTRIDRIRKQVRAEAAAGLAAGGASKAKEAGASTGTAFLDGAKGPKGIDAHSPSKKFRALGEMAGDGFIEGIASKAAAVDNVMAGAFAIPAPQGGRMAGSGASVSVTVGDIHVTPSNEANAQEIGEAVARAVESILPGALQSAHSQMAAQGGEN
jgi:hypothetical protein